MKRVVIVGASLAGLCTARALRAYGFDGELVLVGAEAHRPYDRPPLSKEFLAGRYTEEDLTLESDGEDLSARWLLGRTATGLDPASRTVHLDGGATLRADGIVLATGAVARELPGHPGPVGRRACTRCGRSRTPGHCAPNWRRRAASSSSVPASSAPRSPRPPARWAWMSPWWRRCRRRWPARSASRWARRSRPCTPSTGQR
ncbi:hypothetical protein GCM10027610_057020 [Dactylosporangium cerinum]